MKKYKFPIVVTQDEDRVYVADVPSLPGCHTQAKTLAVLYKRVGEAIELYIEVEKEKKEPMIRHRFVGIKNIAVTA